LGGAWKRPRNGGKRDYATNVKLSVKNSG